MRLTFSMLSLLAMSLGTTALANTQLGGSIGIDTTGLSNAEIAELKTAIEDGDEARVAFILNNEGANAPDVAATAGRVQMAQTLGVSPEDYTLSQMAALLLEGTSPVETGEPLGTVGKEQLAMALGVDPADYTIAELVEMKTSAE